MLFKNSILIKNISFRKTSSLKSLFDSLLYMRKKEKKQSKKKLSCFFEKLFQIKKKLQQAFKSLYKYSLQTTKTENYHIIFSRLKQILKMLPVPRFQKALSTMVTDDTVADQSNFVKRKLSSNPEEEQSEILQSIMAWFESQGVHLGNPEQIIFKYQKEKKQEVYSLKNDGNHTTSNLLARRCVQKLSKIQIK